MSERHYYGHTPRPPLTPPPEHCFCPDLGAGESDPVAAACAFFGFPVDQDVGPDEAMTIRSRLFNIRRDHPELAQKAQEYARLLLRLGPPQARCWSELLDDDRVATGPIPLPPPPAPAPPPPPPPPPLLGDLDEADLLPHERRGTATPAPAQEDDDLPSWARRR
jgi:hypothetical protein